MTIVVKGVTPVLNLFNRITRSLAGKLIVSIGLIVTISAGISWYTLINTSRKNLISTAIAHTANYSDLVKKSIRYSMLTFHREAIQQTIEALGAKEEIRGMRIFDAEGKIFYSTQKHEIGRLVDRNAHTCTGCHIDSRRPLETLRKDMQWIISGGREKGRILTFVEPIYNEPSCYTAACHAHGRERRILGLLETDFSLSWVDEAIRRQTINTGIYAVVFMCAGSIILYFVLRMVVLTPLSALAGAMEKVAEGDLKQTVNTGSQDEIGRLAGGFNVMTRELELARSRMENWAQTLEDEVAKKSEELKKSQDKLIQAEKLASLGRLTADVAHEIRNPLTALGGFAQRLSKIAMNEKEKEYADIIVCNVRNLEKILRNTLAFSNEVRYHLERHDIGEIVRDVLTVYEEICREQSINVEVRIQEQLPRVILDMEQAKQAFINLITNAIDAMPHGGTLKITAGWENMHNVTFVYLKVSDTGQGIPEDKLPMIFEPFFTTKEIGHGTGLGLSIARKILEEHGGFVRAESAPGTGSTFSLFFPYQSEEESLKTNCWEYMKCGRDKDATIKCPAYPNFGRICWAVAGTFCEGKVQGTFAQKYENCKKCAFYQKATDKKEAGQPPS